MQIGSAAPLSGPYVAEPLPLAAPAPAGLPCGHVADLLVWQTLPDNRRLALCWGCLTQDLTERRPQAALLLPPL